MECIQNKHIYKKKHLESIRLYILQKTILHKTILHETIYTYTYTKV